MFFLSHNTWYYRFTTINCIIFILWNSCTFKYILLRIIVIIFIFFKIFWNLKWIYFCCLFMYSIISVIYKIPSCNSQETKKAIKGNCENYTPNWKFWRFISKYYCFTWCLWLKRAVVYSKTNLDLIIKVATIAVARLIFITSAIKHQ